MSRKNSPPDFNANLKEFSAGFIVFSVDQHGLRKYLLLHYPSGHFDFPKGHLEQGESDLQAAIRELTEETGISNIEVISGFEEFIHYGFYRKEGQVLKKVTFFLGQSPAQEITLSHEHQGYLWLEYDQALAKITFDNAKTLLQKAEKHLNKKP